MGKQKRQDPASTRARRINKELARSDRRTTELYLDEDIPLCNMSGEEPKTVADSATDVENVKNTQSS